MTSRNQPCGSWVARLSQHLDGECPDPEAVEAHLRECAACREWVRAAADDEQRVRQAFALAVPDGFAEGVMAGARQPRISPLRRPLGGARLHRALEIIAAAALVALFVGLVTPLLPIARASSRAATCLTNARELSSAMRVYASDYGETLPPGARWDASIAGYVRGLGTFQCPEAGTLPSYCFEQSLRGAQLASFRWPSETVLVFDENERLSGRFEPRHSGQGTAGFLDGRARLLPDLPAQPILPPRPAPSADDQRASLEPKTGWRV
jgi:hypothetical protein